MKEKRKSRVDYGKLDAFKELAQNTAKITDNSIDGLGVRFVEESRRESVQLIEMEDCYVAHIKEGLGTKSAAADATNMVWKSFYDYMGQDAVARIVNSMAASGATPLNVNMHLAVGDSAWFDNKERCFLLIKGWVRACRIAGCVFGGGETSVLKDIVHPAHAVLAGSAVGFIKPKERMISSEKIKQGAAIVLLGSSGVHANGLTLTQDIADKLPNGYSTEMNNGEIFGIALFEPTVIYARTIRDCLDRGIKIHYASNITEQGWRKIMRAEEIWAYIVNKIPKQQEIFKFLQERGNISDKEMYQTFNMNAGFAVIGEQKDVPEIIHIAEGYGITAIEAGRVEESDTKKVVIEPLGLEYNDE